MRLEVPPCHTVTIYTLGGRGHEVEEEKEQSRAPTSAGLSPFPFPILGHIITPTTLWGEYDCFLPADEETGALTVESQEASK